MTLRVFSLPASQQVRMARALITSTMTPSILAAWLLSTMSWSFCSRGLLSLVT
jgi:hypothetical protein